ncbi:hypothetical protein MIR68_002601 [Amoeboaphelidium protococcarum]|nr:hypothetical protein MIR68_002601 [Amoeboaphelidium protococcarum]
MKYSVDNVDSLKQKIKESKDEGNRFVAEQKYKQAIQCYTNALSIYANDCVRNQFRLPYIADQLLGSDFTRVHLDTDNKIQKSFGQAVSNVGRFFRNLMDDSDGDRDDGGSSTSTNVSKYSHDFQSWAELNSSMLKEFDIHILFSNRSYAISQSVSVIEQPPSMAQCALDDAKRSIMIDHRWFKAHVRAGDACCQMYKYEEALHYYCAAVDCKVPKDDERQKIQLKIVYANSMLHLQADHVKVIQMLAGHDFASNQTTSVLSSINPVTKIINGFAASLQNFVYIIVCEHSRKCVLVDVCWDVQTILDFCAQMKFQVVGSVVTHQHFDHVGGKPPEPYSQYGVTVEGVATVLRKLGPSVTAYIHPEDIDEVLRGNPDMTRDQITPTSDGFNLRVGTCVNLEFIHTPGHTKGSQCILVNGISLLSGDTLFINSIGRLDFPESDKRLMYVSLQKIKALAPQNNEDIIVLSGHAYGGRFSSLKREMQKNKNLMAETLSDFIKLT